MKMSFIAKVSLLGLFAIMTGVVSYGQAHGGDLIVQNDTRRAVEIWFRSEKGGWFGAPDKWMGGWEIPRDREITVTPERPDRYQISVEDDRGWEFRTRWFNLQKLIADNPGLTLKLSLSIACAAPKSGEETSSATRHMFDFHFLKPSEDPNHPEGDTVLRIVGDEQ